MEKIHAKTSYEGNNKTEYNVSSSARREVILIINLLEEVKGQGFSIHNSTPNIKCKTFEEN